MPANASARADEQRGVRAEVAAGAGGVGVARHAPRGQRADRAAEREREHDLPQRDPAAVAGERRRVRVGEDARRALEADHEHAERHPGRAPEHAPHRDRRPRAARARPRRGVDQREDRRYQQRHEEELERPAAQHAVAGDEVGRARGWPGRGPVSNASAASCAAVPTRPRRSAESCVRGVDRRALARRASRRCRRRRRRRRPARAWSPCATGATSAATCWPSDGSRTLSTSSSRSACSTVRSQPAAGRRWPSPESRSTSWPSARADRAQGDAGAQLEAAGRMAGELARAGRLGGRAVDRGEHERGLGDAAHERARELDERPGAGAVVVRARARRQDVAAGDEDERVARAALAADDAEHVDHRHHAPVGVGRAEALQRHVRARGAQALGDPVGRRDVARAARGAVGEALARARSSPPAPARRRTSAAASCAAVREPCARRRAARSAGMSTTSQPVRYGPGRSSAAARGARAALRRTLARRDRRSRGAPSGNIGFEYA